MKIKLRKYDVIVLKMKFSMLLFTNWTHTYLTVVYVTLICTVCSIVFQCQSYNNPCSIHLFSYIKGNISVILSDPPCKDGNARFTMVTLKPYSDIKVSPSLPINKKCASHFSRETGNGNKQFKELEILIYNS